MYVSGWSSYASTSEPRHKVHLWLSFMDCGAALATTMRQHDDSPIGKNGFISAPRYRPFWSDMLFDAHGAPPNLTPSRGRLCGPFISTFACAVDRREG